MTAPSPQTENPRFLLARARAAARDLARPPEGLSWSEAQALAPWSASDPPAWERGFRDAFASVLVKRGIAKPAARKGKSGKSGKTKLAERKVYATPEEFAAQDARMAALGIKSWSMWARRKLAE